MLVHKVVLILIFSRDSRLFYIVIVVINIPINSAWDFHFIDTLINHCHLWFLIIAILSRMRWYVVVIKVSFPWWLVWLSVSYTFVRHLYFCHWDIFVQTFLCVRKHVGGRYWNWHSYEFQENNKVGAMSPLLIMKVPVYFSAPEG